MKVWQPGRWYYDVSKRNWCLTKAGEYEVGDMPKVALEIEGRDVQKLIIALDEEGWIKPRLDERLRADDLQITHRLLDIIERGRK